MSDTSLFPTLYNPAANITPRPRGFVDPGRLYPDLPSATKSFNRKYANNNIFQQQLSSPVYNALRNFDAQRVAQGKAPIGQERTAIAATAAETGEAQTPEPTPNFLEAAGQDLTNLVSSIPTLPFALWGEAQKATNLPEYIGKVQQQSNGPLEEISGYLQLPGINLVPGTYTASQLLTGNGNELLQHPLFTALDVFPYANKAASGTKVAKAAVAAEEARAAELTATIGEPFTPRHPNAIKALATNKLVDGQLQRNLLGRGIDAGVGLAERTRPGALVADTWSPQSRQLARAVAGVNKSLRQDFSPMGPATTDPTALWLRDVQTLSDRHPTITPEQRIQITRAITNPVDEAGNPIALGDMGLDDAQLAYATELRDLTERSRILSQQLPEGDELADRNWFGGNEVFSKQQAKRLDNLDRGLDRYRQRVATRNIALDHVYRYLDREQPATINQTIGGVEVNGPNPFYTGQLDNTIDQLRQLQRTDPRAKLVLDLYKRREYKKLWTQLTRMEQKQRYAGILGDETSRQAIHDQLLGLDEAQRTVDDLRGYSEKNLARREANADKIRKTILPARFGEVATGRLQRRMEQYVTDNFIDDPLFQDYLDFVDQGNYSSLLSESDMPLRQFYSLQKEVNQSVADLKQAGVDPVFLHRVTPDSASGIQFPAVLDKRITPSSLKTRTLDVTPYVPDLQIALTHQGLEFLNRRYAEQLMQRIDDTWGVDLAELRRQYYPAAKAARDANPLLDVNQYIDRAIRNDGWLPYDVEQYAPWRKKTGTVAEAATGRMVPGAIKRNLDRMHKPPGIVASVDPVMNVFRTSVLALSPRWLVNNVIGGAMLLAAETPNPLRTLKFLRQAKGMTGDFPWPLRNMDEAARGTLHEVPGMSEGNLNFTAEEVAQLTNTLSDSDKLRAIYQTQTGNWIRKVWDDTQAQKAAGHVVDKFGKVVQKSYDINTWFDDFYRSLAYLTGEDSALAKGLSKEAAESQGIALARKIMQNWDEITPIERTVLRYVFPFYGFMQHIARYVMRYPFDHPWRTAIMGSFARNELEDMGTGLPQRFLSMAFLGNQDEQGNQYALTLGGANPFAAVSDMYTLGGLLGSTNPLISSFAESLGIDPIAGTAELYPNVRYNPETGRLEAQQSNYLQTLAGNVLPFYNVANQTLFDRAEFDKLLRTNPDAAARTLQAQLGIPILVRKVNKPQETIRAELQRVEAQSRAKGEMLRTGNYELADQYPGLNQYLQQIMTLEQQGQLDQYKEPVGTVPNPLQALYNSYAPSVSPISQGVGGTAGYLQRTTLW